jgi:Asp-tRNA(Asn)/Glu-tRNA(Gln) amidotransferase A subunit family amidase
MAARRKILEARSAVDQVAAIAAGEAGVTDALEACLERIGAVEPEVRAFAFLDPDHARREAELLERQRRAGRPIGPLHGLPVGVKDIIDVRGMPAENGTVLDDGRRPGADAALIRALKAAGSLVLGKTRTTELAYYAPTVTRNPSHAQVENARIAEAHFRRAASLERRHLQRNRPADIRLVVQPARHDIV